MLNTQSLTLETIIVQSKDHIVSDMDGEKVILSIQNGKYYNLGNIGGAIWDLINTPISVSELIRSLTQEYTVESKECEEQVIPFLEQLYKQDLIITTVNSI